jgi:hypothetical protein
MIRAYCDKCSEEIKDPKFNFEAMVRRIQEISTLTEKSQDIRPKLEERRIHLCHKCFDTLNL